MDDRREELRSSTAVCLWKSGIAAELTEQRRKAAKQLESEIVRELSELDMSWAKCGCGPHRHQAVPRTAATP